MLCPVIKNDPQSANAVPNLTFNYVTWPDDYHENA